MYRQAAVKAAIIPGEQDAECWDRSGVYTILK